MAKTDFLTAKIKEKHPLPDNFFDLMVGPPVCLFFSPHEQESIKHLILHTKNNSVKIKMLNSIMKSKGFLRLSGGTNRMVYRYLDDPSFVLKVAIDRVGLNDNLAEFKNQQWLKPYVCKIFDTTSDGLMATIERVYPITSKEEFAKVQEEVFYLIVTKIIGRTVADDIGKGFFMNFGIRPQFGVVLLDYPYVYPIDEKKLFCTHIDPNNHRRCTGMIDYDDSFNYLLCRKCGTRYFASDLEDKNAGNDIIIDRGGKYPMKIRVTKSDGTIVEPMQSSIIINPTKKPVNKNHQMTVRVVKEEVPVRSTLETKIRNISTNKSIEEKVISVSMKNSEATVKSEKIETPVEDAKEEVTEDIPEAKEDEVEETIPEIKTEDKTSDEEVVESKEKIEPEPEVSVEPVVDTPAKKKSSKKAGGSKKAEGSKKAGKYISSPGTSEY